MMVDRDLLAQQVSDTDDPATVTVATDLPSTATHFLVTCVGGGSGGGLTLTAVGPNTTWLFAFDQTPFLLINLNKTSGTPVTSITLDAGTGNATLIGSWMQKG